MPCGSALPAGRGTIEATVNAVEPTLPWTLAVRMHGLEPQKLRADLPPARIDLEVSGKGEGPSGRVNLTGLGVALGPNSVKLSGFVDAPKAPLAWQDPLALKGELLIDVGAHDLKALTAVPVLVKAGAPPLSGALLGSIQLTLAERTLRTHANLNGVGLRGFDASLGKLHLEADTVNLGGRVALSLTDLSIAQQRFAHVGLGLGGGPQRLTLEHRGIEAQWQQLAPALRQAARGKPVLLDVPGLERLIRDYLSHARFEEQQYLPLAARIVTTSPDVTVSTNLGPWVNRRGLFAMAENTDLFRKEKIPSTFAWDYSPKGQHMELGIAEMNLFIMLSALGLSHSINHVHCEQWPVNEYSVIIDSLCLMLWIKRQL